MAALASLPPRRSVAPGRVWAIEMRIDQRAAEPTISVVIMAYNEEATVAAFVADMQSELNRLGIPWEIIAVDDGSTDGTGHELRALADRIPGVRILTLHPNQGLGAVYRTGLDEAAGTYVTFFPADAQFPASNVAVLWSAIRGCDAVFGYLDTRADGFAAAALSSVERILYRTMVGPLPRFQGVFMLRREVLGDFTLHSSGRGWGILMELVARVYQGGYQSRSVETVIIPRRSGVSKVRNLRTIVANMKDLLRLRSALSRSPRSTTTT